MKATTFRIAALLVPVTLMQVFLMPNLSILHVSPDALAVLVGFTAISAGRNTSMLTGFIGGMLMGILTGQMGLLMLAGTIGGFMLLSSRFPKSATPPKVSKPEDFFWHQPLQLHQLHHHDGRLKPARSLTCVQNSSFRRHWSHTHPAAGHCRPLSLHEKILC